MSMPLSHFVPSYPSPSPYPQVHSCCCYYYTCYVRGTECFLRARHLLAAVEQTEMNEGYVTGSGLQFLGWTNLGPEPSDALWGLRLALGGLACDSEPVYSKLKAWKWGEQTWPGHSPEKWLWVQAAVVTSLKSFSYWCPASSSEKWRPVPGSVVITQYSLEPQESRKMPQSSLWDQWGPGGGVQTDQALRFPHAATSGLTRDAAFWLLMEVFNERIPWLKNVWTRPVCFKPQSWLINGSCNVSGCIS